MKNKKTIVASLAAIAMSASLACGATYALFTSESTANIAISSGKVNMTAEIENVKLSYLNNIDSEGNGTEVSGSLYAGTATIDGNKITLEKLVPGDKITLDINVYNESNVASKYQTLIGVSEDNGLFDGLVVTLNGNTYNGKTAKSEWNNEAAVSEKTIVETVSVTIELPWNAGNENQDKSCELYLTVNAVQGNALCTNPVENTVELYTARDLLMFAEEVNSGTNYKDWTIVMMNDIDMAGVTMAPIGTLVGGRDFAGTFDGSGKTLKNLTIVGTDVRGTGLFGSNDEHYGQIVVKNLTIDGANISGPKNVGAFIGMSYDGTVENCCVKNSTIIATGEKRASTLVANAVSKVSITNCQAIDCTVVARENAAELFANISEDSANKNNTATRVNVITATAITTAEDLVAFAKDVNENGNSYAGKTVMLMNDIDLNNVAWTPIGQTGGDSAKTYFQGTFDGNGKTISNLTIGESSWEEGSNDGQNFATGFFGFIDVGSTTIKNVTFDHANVEGHHWVGVVAGYMTGTVSDVTVTNSTVTSSYKTSVADGDKAGGIVGCLNQGFITGCTVSDSTVTAVRDNGSVVGYSTANGSVTGNKAKNCTVYYSTDNSDQIGGEIAGKRANGVSDNTATNVTVSKLVTVSTAPELSAALNKTYTEDTTVMLTKDITLSGEWGAHALNATNSAALIIDGNGKTINGLTSTNYYKVNGFNSNGLVTSIGAGFSSVTFKNLTVSGAKLENNDGLGTDSSSATGVFVGNTNTVNVTFDTCSVIGANVNCYEWAGGFIGYTQDVNTTKKSVKLINCVVSDSTINTTDSSVGGLVGHNYTDLTITGCQIKGTTIIKCAEDRTGKAAKAGYLIGTVNAGSASISNITVENTVTLDINNGTTYDTTKYVGRIAANGSVNGLTPNS